MHKLFGAALPLALLLAASAVAQPQPGPATPAVDPAQPAETAAPVAPAAPDVPAPPLAPSAPAPGVALVLRSTTPTFVSQSMATGGLSVVGAVIAMREGGDLVEMDEIPDPANLIGADLAKVYAASVGATVAEKPIVLQGNDGAAALPDAKAQGFRYLVEVSTSTWSSSYFPLDWTHHGVTYGARLKVYDVATGKIIANGNCVERPHRTPESPTGDALLANRGAVLKRMLVEAAQRCAAKLKTETLKL